jgi:hypothetical protein
VLFGIAHWPDAPVLGTLPIEKQLAAYGFLLARTTSLRK